MISHSMYFNQRLSINRQPEDDICHLVLYFRIGVILYMQGFILLITGGCCLRYALCAFSAFSPFSTPCFIARAICALHQAAVM